MLANFKVISFVLTLIAGSAYAFIIPNTVADSPAVYNTSLIFGYDVTGIIFDINDTDPTVVDTITFHIAPSSGSAKADRVEIQTETDGTWTECSLVEDVLPARVATCTFGSLAAEDVTALNIVAR
ncbi:MAG: hypothetical protein EHM40_17895 [Chloroflexi bacterium]|nr:MAG: hypothetical protein EHM40_17895 [Chloroflexota bacterium]